MLLREFSDRDGTHWEVWEAHPRLADRRSLGDRRLVARDTPLRRQRSHGLPPLDITASGWLVFRSKTARRRQQPIPHAWEKLADSELESLLTVSRPSGPRSRVVE